MTDPQSTLPARREYSGSAVLGIGALAIAILLYSLPPVAILFGALSIYLGLRSRAQLKADQELRGTTASVIAFFGGLTVVVLQTAPFLIGLALRYVTPLF